MLELMSERGVKADVITYSSLIHRFCLSGQWKEAASLFHRMMDEGIHPNVKVKEALTMLELMSERDVKPDVITYNSLIHGFCLSGQWKEAAILFHRMMDEGIHPDVVTFSSLIDALCQQKKVKEARRMLEQMSERGLQSTSSYIQYPEKARKDKSGGKIYFYETLNTNANFNLSQ
ncbi:hypothetical protein SCA6_016519 [Theobroma cacao]